MIVSDPRLHRDQQALVVYQDRMRLLEQLHEEQGKEPPTIDEYLALFPLEDRAAWRVLMETKANELDNMFSIALLPGEVITPLEQMYLFLLAASGEDAYCYGEDPINLWLWDTRIALPLLTERVTIIHVMRLGDSGQWRIVYTTLPYPLSIEVQRIILHIHPPMSGGEPHGGYEDYARRRIAEAVMHAAWSKHDLSQYHDHHF